METYTIKTHQSDKIELLKELNQNGIQMNESGEIIWHDNRFVLPKLNSEYTLISLSIRELGFEEKATSPKIFEAAKKKGFDLCPIGIAPFLRLALHDQKEDPRMKIKYQAPFGSITIASEPISEDPQFPRGFYIVRRDDVNWLRGYHCDDTHLWSTEDVFLFIDKRF